MALLLSQAGQPGVTAVNVGVPSPSTGMVAGLPMTTSVISRSTVTQVSTSLPVSVVSTPSHSISSTMIMSTSVGSPIMTPVSSPIHNYGASTSQPSSQPSGVWGPVMSQPMGGPSSAPSSWVADPLTSALRQLTNVVDPDMVCRTAGMVYRPEYYAQHLLWNIPIKSLDHKQTFL